jgi:phenylacetate-CoA ligase
LGVKRLNEIAPIELIQLVQTSLEHIEVRLVVPREISREEEEGFSGILRERLGYPFELTFTYHDEIPRGPGGKFEQFRSEIPG